MTGGMRLAAAVMVAVLVAGACGGDDSADSGSDDPADGGATTASGEAYLDAAAGVWAPLDARAEEVFLALDAAGLSGSEAAVLLAAGEGLAEARDALDTASDRLAALDPPPDHRDDHARLIRLMDDLEVELDRAQASVDDEDIDSLRRAQADIGMVIERNLSEVSAPLAARLATAANLTTRYPELTEEDVTYLAGVNAAGLEFGELNAAFGQAIRRSYSNSARLLEALIEAGVGQGFVAQRDAALRLEPTERFSEDHDDYMAYLDDSVAIDERARDAAEGADIVAFNAANAELAVAAAALSATTSEAFREARGEIALAEDLPGGDAGPALARSLQQVDVLLQGFLGPVSVYDFLGVLTEDERRSSTAAVAPVLGAEIEAARDRVADLEPEPDLVADHERILDYLDELIEAHEDIATEATADSGPAAAIDRLVDAWCSASSAVGPDAAAIAAVHFGPAPADPRCD